MERQPVGGEKRFPGDSDGILRDLDSDSPVLAITFGGLVMRMGLIPPFEFFRILSDSAAAKKLFIRDHQQAWYHKGVRGAAADIEGLERAIRSIVAEVNPAKTVMLGTSAGGYAALLFGRLLAVDEVHAFSPQTFISPGLRSQYGDERWPERWPALVNSDAYQREYGDLCELYRRIPSQETRFVIHYSGGDRLGGIHAERLGDWSEVELRKYEMEGHNVVVHLRERGELQQLLRGLLAVA